MTGTDTTPNWNWCCVRMSRCSIRQVPLLLGGSVAGGIPTPGGTSHHLVLPRDYLDLIDRQLPVCLTGASFRDLRSPNWLPC